MFKARRVAIVATTKCTLNCRLCSNHMPLFKDPKNFSGQEIKTDIDLLFTIFDHIEWIQFVGGEVFLNKDMTEIYRHTLKYIDRIDKLVLMTNATLIPTADEVKALSAFGEKALIQISDYGKLSYKIEECKKTYTENGIPFEIKIYYGDRQHYGGWVDNTDVTEINETDVDFLKRTSICSQVKMNNMHALGGRLYRCSNGAFLSALNIKEPDKRDFVDLRDTFSSLEEKRAIIAEFYNQPTAICHICRNSQTGKESAKRYNAAEQI